MKHLSLTGIVISVLVTGCYGDWDQTPSTSMEAVGIDSVSAAAAIVIDDNNANNNASVASVEFSGSWVTSAGTPGYWEDGYRFASTAAVSDQASFWFYLDSAQSRTVDVRWTAGSNRSPAAPFQIYNASGTLLDTVHVDQSTNGSQWNELGTFSFTAGWNRVALSRWTGSGFVVIADAVRVQAGTDPGPGDDQLCFLGPNRNNDVCVPLSFPGTPAGYSYPSPLNGNYRAPIAYIDLQEVSGSTQIAPNFQLSELAQLHKGRYAAVQPHAVARLQALRAAAGPLVINSGYRSPSYNASVGGATRSRHMYGDAFDIDPLSISVDALEPICTANGGFLVEYTTHVHCDWRNDPQDPLLFGPPTLNGFGLEPFEQPFSAEIIDDAGVLTARAIGFDEGEPARRWTALDADGEVLAEGTGAEFTPPRGTATVLVELGRVVEATLDL